MKILAAVFSVLRDKEISDFTHLVVSLLNSQGRLRGASYEKPYTKLVFVRVVFNKPA